MHAYGQAGGVRNFRWGYPGTHRTTKTLSHDFTYVEAIQVKLNPIDVFGVTNLVNQHSGHSPLRSQRLVPPVDFCLLVSPHPKAGTRTQATCQTRPTVTSTSMFSEPPLAAIPQSDLA